MAEDRGQPSWGATVGMYFACLLSIGFVAGMVCMVSKSGVFSVGGLLSWIAAFAPAGYYRSTGKGGAAFGIALGIGVAIGVIAIVIGPSIIQARYGAA